MSELNDDVQWMAEAATKEETSAIITGIEQYRDSDSFWNRRMYSRHAFLLYFALCYYYEKNEEG